MSPSTPTRSLCALPTQAMPQSVAATRAGVVNRGALIDSFDFRQHCVWEREREGEREKEAADKSRGKHFSGQVQVIKANKNNKHNFPAVSAASSRIALRI